VCAGDRQRLLESVAVLRGTVRAAGRHQRAESAKLQEQRQRRPCQGRAARCEEVLRLLQVLHHRRPRCIRASSLPDGLDQEGCAHPAECLRQGVAHRQQGRRGGFLLQAEVDPDVLQCVRRHVHEVPTQRIVRLRNICGVARVTARPTGSIN
jgi:hypothetical protein